MENATCAESTVALKRAANAILRHSSDSTTDALPYFCECDDAACLRAVWLGAADYDRLRRGGAIYAIHDPGLAETA